MKYTLAFLVLAGYWPAAIADVVDQIRLPPGFRIELYAEVPNARSLAVGDNGTVFVGNRTGGSVYALVADGNAVRVIELLDGLKRPNGIAVHDGDLYVAETDRVTRYPDIESHLDDVPKGEVLPISLPSKSSHGWRYIAFGPDDKLYISIGVPCNVCEEAGYGVIDRMNPDGSGRETYASGVRNSVGFTWHPATGVLWFTDNGRDWLGDDLPPDELNRAPAMGMHFGFPYCHAGDIPDEEFGKGRDCNDYVPPIWKFGAHVAPLGIEFYTGEMFPEAYRGQLFVAEHGSWNRSKKTGYRISLVRLENGVPVSGEVFADGWLQGEKAFGYPVDFLVLPDGSMLLSDDEVGRIYRITYEETAG